MSYLTTFKRRASGARRRHHPVSVANHHFSVGTHIDQHGELFFTLWVNFIHGYRQQTSSYIRTHMAANERAPVNVGRREHPQPQLFGAEIETRGLAQSGLDFLLRHRHVGFLANGLDVEAEKDIPHGRVAHHHYLINQAAVKAEPPGHFTNLAIDRGQHDLLQFSVVLSSVISDAVHYVASTKPLGVLKGGRVKDFTRFQVDQIHHHCCGSGVNGQTELVRMFVPQHTKEALIIDERFNSGGQIPDRFVELLNRPLLHYWGVRDGRDWQWPPIAHAGPKVMLINQWSGSGGDAFPYYFRKAGLGPLIGKRTWGGLIGISGAPRLIDGGVVTVPTFGSYGMDGEWIIENQGVAPDIEVVDDPALMTDGGDPQLDAAIEEIKRLLKDRPFKAPTKPKYPDKSGY